MSMLCLELLGVCIQALYTNFFASRQRRLLVFRRSGHSTTCRCPNSDSAEALHNRFYYSLTRILPLPAIAKAPHLRFGGSPATTITSRLLPQRLSSRIRDSFDLTFLARLSTLVQRICTEFLLFSL